MCILVCYYDYSNDSLKYATNASGAWVTQTLSTEWLSSLKSSIAIDSSDNVHIVYETGSWYGGELKYVTNASGAWVTQILDSSGDFEISGYYLVRSSFSLSIALDSSDNVHISYSKSEYYEYVPVYMIELDPYKITTFKYATNASGTWETETVDSEGDIAGSTSIAIDSSNNVHIIYTSLFDEVSSIMYVTNASGAWVNQIIDYGGSASIAIDSSDNVHITYTSFFDEVASIMYMTNASGVWVNQIIDYGESTSVAIDSTDNVHISYWDYINYDLKYATTVNTPSCKNKNRGNGRSR